MEGDLFYADGRTDRQTGTTKLIIVFSNYANARKIARLKFSFSPLKGFRSLLCYRKTVTSPRLIHWPPLIFYCGK